MRFDKKDQRIVEILQEDARISNRAVARLVGLSNSACCERVRKLERAGAILGYHARIAPSVETGSFEVWASVALADLPNATQDSFLTLLQGSEHVVSIFQLAGAFDCLFHFIAPDANAWRLFCGEISLAGVAANRLSFGIVVNSHPLRRP